MESSFGRERSYEFILNSRSGTGKVKQAEAVIREFVSRNQAAASITFTRWKEHAVELANQSTKNIVVAVGGDGTVSEVARGIAGTGKALAILPCGSGNGYAHHIGMSENPASALQQILEGSVLPVDMASWNGRQFLNIAGLGLEAEVAHAFHRRKWRGLAGYLLTFLQCYVRSKEFSLELEVDGIRHQEQALSMAFAKGSEYGNHAIIAPMANLQDGLIHVCTLPASSARRWFDIIRNMAARKGVPEGVFHYRSGKEIRFAYPRELHVHFDGEAASLPAGEQVIRVEPLSLPVIMPGKAAGTSGTRRNS